MTNDERLVLELRVRDGSALDQAIEACLRELDAAHALLGDIEQLSEVEARKSSVVAQMEDDIQAFKSLVGK